MARTILESTGEDTTVGGLDHEVIGTAGGGEYITVAGLTAADIELDASFNNGGDTISLPGDADSYTAVVIGSRIVLTSTFEQVTVSIPIPQPGATIALVFRGDDSTALDDDTRVISFNGTTVLIGGEEVDGTPRFLDSVDATQLEMALENLQDAEEDYQEFLAENDVVDADADGDIDADDAEVMADECDEDLAAARDIQTDSQLIAEVNEQQADVEAARTDLIEAEQDIDDVEGLREAIAAEEQAEADLAQAQLELAAAEAARDEEQADVDELELEIAAQESEVLEERAEAEAARVAADPSVGDDSFLVLREDDADADENPEVGILGDPATLADPNDETRLGGNIVDTLSIDPDIEVVVIDNTDNEILIIRDENTGELVLAEGVTEVTHPGITLLLTELRELDEEEAELEAMQEQLIIEQAEADAAQEEYEDELDEFDDAQAARDAAVAATEALDPGGVLRDARDDAASDLAFEEEQLREAIEDLEEREMMIAECEELREIADEARELEADRDAAADDLSDLGYDNVIILNDSDVEYQATEDSDAFIYTNQQGVSEYYVIDDFGDQGEDVLYMGDEYTLVYVAEGVEIGAVSVGDNDVLEIFVQQQGDDTVLFVEEVTEGGNVSQGGFNGDIIVFEDTDATDVSMSMNEGFIYTGNVFGEAGA